MVSGAYQADRVSRHPDTHRTSSPGLACQVVYALLGHLLASQQYQSVLHMKQRSVHANALLSLSCSVSPQSQSLDCTHTYEQNYRPGDSHLAGLSRHGNTLTANHNPFRQHKLYEERHRPVSHHIGCMCLGHAKTRSTTNKAVAPASVGRALQAQAAPS